MVIGKQMFDNYLEDDEQLIAICHRHPFVYLGDMARILLIGLGIPFFLYLVFPEIVLIWVIWGIAGVVKIMYSFLVWYYDVLLITNNCIIDVKWNGFFDRTSSRMEYQMVEGVTTQIKGVLHVIFNFGNLKVTGSGGGSYIHLNDAINPKNVETLIMAHQEKYISQKNLSDADSLKDLLVTIVKQHIKAKSEVSE